MQNFVFLTRPNMLSGLSLLPQPQDSPRGHASPRDVSQPLPEPWQRLSSDSQGHPDQALPKPSGLFVAPHPRGKHGQSPSPALCPLANLLIPIPRGKGEHPVWGVRCPHRVPGVVCRTEGRAISETRSEITKCNEILKICPPD